MAAASFDVEWPVMRITLPSTMEIPEIDDFCGTISRNYAERDGWVQVVDMSAVQPMSVPATTRRHFASASDVVDRDFPNGTRAQAICSPSTVVRGVFTAYSWLKNHSGFEIKTFASQAEADPWVQQWAVKLGGTAKPLSTGA